MIDRRTFVRTAAVAAGTAAVSRRLPALSSLLQAPTLKGVAASKGILFGSAARGEMLNDAAYEQAFVRECAILTPESELKWGTLRPSPDRYNFGPGDALLKFAESNGLKMRGHTLAFWQSIPGWFKSYVTPENARQVLTQHIQNVCGHYAGKLHSWDVLNEAVNPDDRNPDGLRNSPWLTLIGPDYIPLAFNTARAADPSALLVYNDYGIEYDFPGVDARRTAMLNLLHKMKSQNVPVQAFGIQAHLYGDNMGKMNARAISSFFKDVSDMGLKILITELDVTDAKLPADPTARDQAIANAYSTYLDVALKNPNVIVVETWGLSDKYTWLSQHAPRADGQAARVMPLDVSLNPKAAYQSIVQAFQNAPTRAA